MKQKAAVLTALMILGAAGGAAISWETVGDIACTSMSSFISVSCLPILYDDIIDSDADLVQNDIYQNALQINDSRDQLMKEQRSHLNQTYGMGMAEAKLTAIQALNNGSTKAEAKQMALNDLKDFYSVQEQRLINYDRREVIKWNETVKESIQQTSGLSYQDVIGEPIQSKIFDLADSSNEGSWYVEIREKNYTLRNGTQTEVLQMHFYADDGATSETRNVRYVSGFTSPSYDKALSSNKPAELVVESTDGNGTAFMNVHEVKETRQKILDNYNRAKDNVLPLVEDVYANYQQGDVNTSEVLGPLEALQLASTSYKDTGFYSYRALSLEQQGLASNDSYAFNVTWQNDGALEKTDIGQLFVADGAYNGTIEQGVQYDASGKTVFFVHTPEDKDKAVRTPFNGTFTVNEMTDKETGEEVNQTGLQSVEFYTTGTEDLEKQLEEAEENQADLGSTGGVIGGASSWLADALNSIIPSGIPKISSEVAAAGAGIAILLLAIVA